MPRRRAPLRRRRIPRRRRRMARQLFSGNYVRVLGRRTVPLSITTAGVGTGFILTQTFNQLPTDIKNLSGVYEQYKICGLGVKYIPRYTEAQLSATSGTPSALTVTTGLPSVQMLTCIDHSNFDLPTNADSLLQYRRVKVRPMTRAWSTYFKPSCAAAVLTQPTVSTIAGASPTNRWLDSADFGVLFGSMKIYLNALPLSITAGTVLGDFYITAYVSFRRRR